MILCFLLAAVNTALGSDEPTVTSITRLDPLQSFAIVFPSNPLERDGRDYQNAVFIVGHAEAGTIQVPYYANRRMVGTDVFEFEVRKDGEFIAKSDGRRLVGQISAACRCGAQSPGYVSWRNDAYEETSQRAAEAALRYYTVSRYIMVQ